MMSVYSPRGRRGSSSSQEAQASHRENFEEESKRVEAVLNQQYVDHEEPAGGESGLLIKTPAWEGHGQAPWLSQADHANYSVPSEVLPEWPSSLQAMSIDERRGESEQAYGARRSKGSAQQEVDELVQTQNRSSEVEASLKAAPSDRLESEASKVIEKLEGEDSSEPEFGSILAKQSHQPLPTTGVHQAQTHLPAFHESQLPDKDEEDHRPSSSSGTHPSRIFSSAERTQEGEGSLAKGVQERTYGIPSMLVFKEQSSVQIKAKEFKHFRQMMTNEKDRGLIKEMIIIELLRKKWEQISPRCFNCLLNNIDFQIYFWDVAQKNLAQPNSSPEETQEEEEKEESEGKKQRDEQEEPNGDAPKEKAKNKRKKKHKSKQESKPKSPLKKEKSTQDLAFPEPIPTNPFLQHDLPKILSAHKFNALQDPLVPTIPTIPIMPGIPIMSTMPTIPMAPIEMAEEALKYTIPQAPSSYYAPPKQTLLCFEETKSAKSPTRSKKKQKKTSN